MSPQSAKASESINPDAPQPAKSLLWIALSACSSTILLATTNLLCQDLSVIPLLWVVPLSIYLISFIFTFDSNRWYKRGIFWPLYFFVVGLALKPRSLGYQQKSRAAKKCRARSEEHTSGLQSHTESLCRPLL